MQKLSNHTKRLLRRIKHRILKEPRQFCMSGFFVSSDDLEATWEIPNCNTAACIAGWALVLSKNSSPRIAREACRGSGFRIDSTARIVLEIDFYQSTRLFYQCNWPLRFQRFDDEGTAEFAQQAAARIDHFIATEGEE